MLVHVTASVNKFVEKQTKLNDASTYGSISMRNLLRSNEKHFFPVYSKFSCFMERSTNAEHTRTMYMYTEHKLFLTIT